MTDTGGAATMPDMAKAKASKGGGDNRKRIGVNFTADWHAVIRKLAGKRKMPVLWYLLELAREDAERNGVADLPPLPWDEGEEGE